MKQGPATRLGNARPWNLRRLLDAVVPRRRGPALEGASSRARGKQGEASKLTDDLRARFSRRASASMCFAGYVSPATKIMGTQNPQRH